MRQPSGSANASWSPSLSLVRLAISRDPAGQAERSTRSVISQTWECSRCVPSARNRLLPCALRQAGERVADALVDVEAEREAQLAVAAELRQLVARAGAVGAHQDLPGKRLGVELLERELQHGSVIGGGVRAGVAGPQHAGQRLARAVEVAQHCKPASQAGFRPHEKFRTSPARVAPPPAGRSEPPSRTGSRRKAAFHRPGGSRP